MGKLDNFVKCFRFCRSHCNGQFVFRIGTLFVLILGTALQAIAISPDTKWDTFETVLHYKFVPQPIEISAYQTLYDVFPVKTVPKNVMSQLPPVYPKEKNELNVAWKRIIVTYETASMGLAAVCILIFENALLIHFLIPNSHFSRFFQPIVLITVILASLGAGILAIFSALEYKQNYQKVLKFNNPDKASAAVLQVLTYLKQIHFDYNIADNVVSTGFYLAISSGALFCLTSALTIVILILYLYERFGMSKTTPVGDVSDTPKTDERSNETEKDGKIKPKMSGGKIVTDAKENVVIVNSEKKK